MQTMPTQPNDASTYYCSGSRTIKLPSPTTICIHFAPLTPLATSILLYSMFGLTPCRPLAFPSLRPLGRFPIQSTPRAPLDAVGEPNNHPGFHVQAPSGFDDGERHPTDHTRGSGRRRSGPGVGDGSSRADDSGSGHGDGDGDSAGAGLELVGPAGLIEKDGARGGGVGGTLAAGVAAALLGAALSAAASGEPAAAAAAEGEGGPSDATATALLLSPRHGRGGREADGAGAGARGESAANQRRPRERETRSGRGKGGGASPGVEPPLEKPFAVRALQVGGRLLKRRSALSVFMACRQQRF